MNNRDFNSLILNLSCKDMFSNIKECAEQCYYREKNGVGCVAFLKYKNTEECYICNPATISEIISNNTQINENDVHLVYVLKYKKKKPVMYLPLEGDNITDTTVNGEGVNGTLINKEYTEIEAGKVNEGLRIWDRARLVLDGTVNKCIANLAVCTKGLSMAVWVKPSELFNSGGYIANSDYSISIMASRNEGIRIRTRGLPNSFLGFVTQSTMSVGTWTHVAVVFDTEAGMFVYMDGILDTFKSIVEVSPVPSLNEPHDYVFGSKVNGGYYFEGTLDEIKVFYDSLTSTVKFYY